MSSTYLLILTSFLTTALCAPECLQQRPHLPVLFPPKLDDCFIVARFIGHGDKSTAPITFSRDSQAGFQVPYGWDNLPGTCVVHIDMVSEDNEDTFPMIKIAHKVADIIEECLLDPRLPNLGGRDLVGPKQEMKVYVSGRPWPRQIEQSNNVTALGRIFLNPPRNTVSILENKSTS